MSHRSPLEQAHAQALFLAQQLLPNPLDHPRYEFVRSGIRFSSCMFKHVQTSFLCFRYQVRYLKNDSSHHGFFTALAKDKELDARVILKFLPRKKVNTTLPPPPSNKQSTISCELELQVSALQPRGSSKHHLDHLKTNQSFTQNNPIFAGFIENNGTRHHTAFQATPPPPHQSR